MSSSTNFSFSSPMPILILLVFASLLVVPTRVSTSRNTSVNLGFHATLNLVDSIKNLTKTELLKRAVGRGRQRMEMLHANIMRHHSHDVLNINAPIHQESFEFIMNLSIGTPPVAFSAIVDTGSDLIWTQCKPCLHCFNQSSPIFDPAKSTSYSKLNCASKLCKAMRSLDDSRCNKYGYCEYLYHYGGGSMTQGYLATETLTFEGNTAVPKVGFGCGVNNQETPEGIANGIVGLGRGDVSLVSQLQDSKFSYCLPSYDSNKTGIISMGSRVKCSHPHMNTTDLIRNPSPSLASLYYLSLQGISINQTRLHINESSFAMTKNGSRGVIIDSGTTLTYLEKSAFQQVKNELTRQIKLPVSDVDEGFDLCFNVTSHQSIKLPPFTFHFNEADWVLPPENIFYAFIDDDTKQPIVCLMMEPSFFDDGISIFGNYQQQNTLVVYDLAKQKLSFLSNIDCHKLL